MTREKLLLLITKLLAELCDAVGMQNQYQADDFQLDANGCFPKNIAHSLHAHIEELEDLQRKFQEVERELGKTKLLKEAVIQSWLQDENIQVGDDTVHDMFSAALDVDQEINKICSDFLQILVEQLRFLKSLWEQVRHLTWA